MAESEKETKLAEHEQRHVELHAALDELLADYLLHNSTALPSKMSVMDLVRWSKAQTENPTELPDG